MLITWDYAWKIKKEWKVFFYKKYMFFFFWCEHRVSSRVHRASPINSRLSVAYKCEIRICFYWDFGTHLLKLLQWHSLAFLFFLSLTIVHVCMYIYLLYVCTGVDLHKYVLFLFHEFPVLWCRSLAFPGSIYPLFLSLLALRMHIRLLESHLRFSP